MAAPRDSQPPANDLIDAVFTGSPPERKAPTEVRPPQDNGSRVGAEWLAEERRSLEEFTRKQFQVLRQQQEMLEQQRQDVLRRQNDVNEMCLLRQQELNRQIKVLTAQAEGLEGREKDLTEREHLVAVEQQKLARMRQDIQQYRKEAAEQERRLEELKAETTRLLAEEQAARQQLKEDEGTLRQRSESLRTECEEVAGRVRALAEGEAELARRLAEVEELQSLLRQEVVEKDLEGLRQQIAEHNKVLEESRAEVARTKEAEGRGRRHLQVLEDALAACRKVRREEEADWEARLAPMEQRYRALEQAEAAVEHRAAELDRLEARIQMEREESECYPVRRRNGARASYSDCVHG